MKTSLTKSINQNDINRVWWPVDASEINLGRLSTMIADKLIGKNKPNYTPHVDNGDFVIVINADKLKVSGDKRFKKKYYRHSGYPGNLKTSSLDEEIYKNSSRVIVHSVKGMLPKNKLIDGRLKRLKVYRNEEHGNQAQKLTKMEIKA